MELLIFAELFYRRVVFISKPQTFTTMKKVLISALAAVVLLSAFTTINPEKKAPATYKVDTKQSTFNWAGNAVGHGHVGKINLTSGNLTVDGTKVTGGSFDIDMNSISCTDLTDKEKNGQFIGHMKSEDFFNTGKYPTAKFEITKMTPNTQAAGKNNYDVTGKLTIKGITQEVSFPSTVVIVGNKLTSTAKFKLDRTKWDIKYGSDLIGTAQDKIIYNDFDINFNLVAAK
jgi:polyisoprenoid-binding protein YceI